jgi:CRP-like cAMP-binding protein
VSVHLTKPQPFALNLALTKKRNYSKRSGAKQRSFHWQGCPHHAIWADLGLVLPAHQCCQPETGTVQAAFDGANRNLADLSRLIIGHPMRPHQEQRFPLVSSKLRQVCAEILAIKMRLLIRLGLIYGSEGVVGVAAAAVTNRSFGRYVVQLSGTGSRIKLDKMHEVVSTRPTIQRLMQNCTEAVMSRILQNVACNAIHSVEARCACLILSTRHQGNQEIMLLTHEFWADRSGTQRSTVSAIMKRFQTSLGQAKQGRHHDHGPCRSQRGLLRMIPKGPRRFRAPVAVHRQKGLSGCTLLSP